MGKISEKLKVQASKKAGLPPGALVHIGEKSSNRIRISVIDYNAAEINENSILDVSDCQQYKNAETNTWINIDGVHNTKVIESIGRQFNLHTLMMEDIMNTLHRPGTEQHDDHMFFSLKMLGITESNDEIVVEQVSLILGDHWLISFQEREGDIFDQVRNRLRDPNSVVRKSEVDYLFYRLIDSIVDNYFFVIEFISEEIEILEEEILSEETEDIRREIQEIKRNLLLLRKSVLPLREAVSVLTKEENAYIKKTTVRYLRDVYDHIIQVNDYADTQRDLLSGLLDLYLSGISNKMNEVMKLLTMISTIFIPLTFIAGIYGMNFDNIPELRWHYGYFVTLGIMAAVFVLMMFYFKRRNWL